MTDTDMLKGKIKESGYKLSWIAEKLGITSFSLQKKIKNETEFKASEISMLTEILGLRLEEVENIFLSKSDTESVH